MAGSPTAETDIMRLQPYIADPTTDLSYAARH